MLKHPVSSILQHWPFSTVYSSSLLFGWRCPIKPIELTCLA